MPALLQRFIADRKGNVAIMGAGCMILVVGCAAFGVDIGTIFADRRKTQSAADLAAIVAASNLPKAESAARTTVVDNAYPPEALVSVELGTYTPSAALPPEARFVTPPNGVANAARVTVQTRTPLYFGRLFAGVDQFQITSRATAASTAVASFAIGSRLLAVNGGLLNAVLGSMLGTTLSLSVMDYQALASARIDALDFLSALAARANVTAGTYRDVLDSSVKVGDVIGAMVSAQQAANGINTATSALQQVSLALAGITTKIMPAQLIDLGPYRDLAIGEKPRSGVDVAALDILKASAALANGTHQIAAAANLNLPGIASVALTATVGELPRGTSWIAVGTQGASVHTAQTRVLLQLKLLGSGSVSVVNLPIYVEVASGTATLDAVSCGYPDVSSSTVRLGVTPGIVDAWIGNVSVAELNNFTSKPNPGPAKLVDLGAVTVSGKAHAGIGNTASTPVTFSYADIQAMTRKTVTTSNFTQSLTASLLGDLSLNIQVGPLGLPIPGLGGLVTGIIGNATGSIDQVLAQVLATLGIGLGQADVWVTGIRCDRAVLVN
ncbi:MAG TPA: pilus assembly protein TadG-related protein [Xanthobacteraceae bacterium]|nr:pilus assembly protein TadG-related protein [Xanthobacteraceae bacterium]